MIGGGRTGDSPALSFAVQDREEEGLGVGYRSRTLRAGSDVELEGSLVIIGGQNLATEAVIDEVL